MHCLIPARRGSRSRPPLRRPRLLRFERLRVPVWNPYSRGRLGPAKSEDRKGGEGKTDANLTNFFLAPAAPRYRPGWHDGSARLAGPKKSASSFSTVTTSGVWTGVLLRLSFEG